MSTLRHLLEELTDLVEREPHRADLEVKVAYGVADEDGDVWEVTAPLDRVIADGRAIVLQVEDAESVS